MADRKFSDESLSIEKAVVTLYIDFTVGAAGAPTLVAANSKGIKGIVRNSAGDYTITLQDTYRRTMAVGATFVKATVAAAPTMTLKASSVNTKPPTFEIAFFNSAGTATDPASGEEILIEAQFSNTSAF